MRTLAKIEWAKGDVVEGKVTSLDQTGAWIAVHDQKVFLPLSEIAWYEIEHPSEILTVGETVRISIIRRDKQGVYHATLRQVREEEDEELVIEVIVEVPKGSRNKYTIDHQSGAIRLDRVFHSSLQSPVEYGYVPNTLANDGDELDVMILIAEPTFPGCRIECRIVGLLRMTDVEGIDDKLLAVPTKDTRFQDVFTLSEVSSHTLKEITRFFKMYRELEGRETEVVGWLREIEAKRIYLESKDRYDANQQA